MAWDISMAPSGPLSLVPPAVWTSPFLQLLHTLLFIVHFASSVSRRFNSLKFGTRICYVISAIDIMRMALLRKLSRPNLTICIAWHVSHQACGVAFIVLVDPSELAPESYHRPVPVNSWQCP